MKNLKIAICLLTIIIVGNLFNAPISTETKLDTFSSDTLTAMTKKIKELEQILKNQRTDVKLIISRPISFQDSITSLNN